MCSCSVAWRWRHVKSLNWWINLMGTELWKKFQNMKRRSATKKKKKKKHAVGFITHGPLEIKWHKLMPPTFVIYVSILFYSFLYSHTLSTQWASYICYPLMLMLPPEAMNDWMKRTIQPCSPLCAPIVVIGQSSVTLYWLPGDSLFIFYLLRCCSSSQNKSFIAISSWPCTRTPRTLMEPSVSRIIYAPK